MCLKMKRHGRFENMFTIKMTELSARAVPPKRADGDLVPVPVPVGEIIVNCHLLSVSVVRPSVRPSANWYIQLTHPTSPKKCSINNFQLSQCTLDRMHALSQCHWLGRRKVICNL
jgi:hypothetical protein